MVAKVTHSNMLAVEHSLIELGDQLGVALKIDAVRREIVTIVDGRTTVVLHRLIDLEEGLVAAEKQRFSAVGYV